MANKPIPASDINVFQDETSAILLSSLDDNFTEITSRINDANTYSNYAVDSGAANAYIITYTNIVATYTAGLSLQFQASNTNTGASTINVNGQGLKNIVLPNGAALPAGSITAGSIIDIQYDGTNFQLKASNVLVGATTGLVVKKSDGTTSSRNIAVSGTGLTVQNASGDAGNPTIVLNSSTNADSSSIVARDVDGNFAANVITASLQGNAATATRAGALSGGSGGQVPFQSAANTTGFIPAGVSGQFLVSQGTGQPKWDSPIASAGYLGLVKIGTGLAITSDGTMSATGATQTNSVSASFGAYVGQVSFHPSGNVPVGWIKANGGILNRTTYADLWEYAKASGNIVPEASWVAGKFSYGDGDANSGTTFRIPDLRGEFIRGWDDGRGIDSGRDIGTWQDSDNKSHTHTSSITGSHSHTTDTAGSHTHSVSDPGHRHTAMIQGGGYSHTVSNVGDQPYYTLPGSVSASTTGISIQAAGAHSHTVSSVGDHSHTIGSTGGTESKPRNVALVACICYKANLPTASLSSYGSVRIGAGINVTADGTISVSNSTWVDIANTQTISGAKTFTSNVNIELNTTSPTYNSGHLVLTTTNNSSVSMGFHRAGSTACQLRHDSNGLILSGVTQTTAADFYAYGNITAFSDIRLKKNIVKIDQALDKVSKISGYTFERTNEAEDQIGKRQLGVIAQELLDVIPEAVFEQNGYYSVAYGNVVGLLIEAIKELKAEIDTLKGTK